MKDKTSKIEDAEDRKMLGAYTRGALNKLPASHALAKQIKQSAKKHLQKQARVNIRLSQEVLDSLKRQAREEGLPYQTLISSVLHRFAHGRLVPQRGR